MHPNRDKVNVLLVGDQPSKLLSYEVILEELGENLIKAASGKEALAQLLRREFAVILVDVAMPELDGFELAAMIREHPRFEQTAIIFVSAVHLSEFDSLRGYQAALSTIFQSRLFLTSCAPRFAFSVICTGRRGSWKRLTRSWRREWKPARQSLRQQMRTWKSESTPGRASAKRRWRKSRRCKSSKALDSSPAGWRTISTIFSWS
jgi:CheY-like chemotaxis protein